jgi:transcription termination/antitermination protein NusG
MYGWYVIQCFSTSEARVKKDLESRAQEGRISGLRQVVLPSEPKSEVVNGRKVTNMRRTLPGYVLVNLDPSSYSTIKAVRATKGVIAFVGGTKEHPSPLTQAEVDRLIHRPDKPDQRPKIVLDVSVGDEVEIADGHFDGFVGKVSEVNEDGGTLKVVTAIFGRPTPVEVGFDQLRLAA